MCASLHFGGYFCKTPSVRQGHAGYEELQVPYLMEQQRVAALPAAPADDVQGYILQCLRVANGYREINAFGDSVSPSRGAISPSHVVHVVHNPGTPQAAMEFSFPKNRAAIAPHHHATGGLGPGPQRTAHRPHVHGGLGPGHHVADAAALRAAAAAPGAKAHVPVPHRSPFPALAGQAPAHVGPPVDGASGASCCVEIDRR